MSKNFVVGVDFDGTCVITKTFPKIECDMPGSVATLKRFVRAGAKIVLLTQREGEYLQAAKDWFKAKKIPLIGVNENVLPLFQSCRKLFTTVSIDDRNAGIPKLDNGLLDWGLIGQDVLVRMVGWSDSMQDYEAPVRIVNVDTPVSELKAGDQIIVHVNKINYSFRWCPAGTFMMGSPEGEDSRDYLDENLRVSERLHPVTISRGFWMLDTPVTQDMYRSVFGTVPGGRRSALRPVTQVSMKDAAAFCDELSIGTGRCVKLPTEAEWEYACRAGTTSAFAGNVSNMGWYDSNSGNKVHLVGKRAANPWGLYDMHGNVWEWCADTYVERFSEVCSEENPYCDIPTPYNVVRGGGYKDSMWACRSAYRGAALANYAYDHIGFRPIMFGVEAE